MTKVRATLVGLALAGIALAQTGTPVRISDDPSVSVVTTVPVISGTQTIAVCYALSTVTTGLRATMSVSISAASNANPVVLTSSGHGFSTWMRPQVTIVGATGGWTSVNGTFTATVIDANTFSIPVNSTTFGALSGALTFTTTAPRTTMPEWAVQKISYDGSGNVVGKGWLNGGNGYSSKCSDATSTTVQLQ